MDWPKLAQNQKRKAQPDIDLTDPTISLKPHQTNLIIDPVKCRKLYVVPGNLLVKCNAVRDFRKQKQHIVHFGRKIGPKQHLHCTALCAPPNYVQPFEICPS